MLAVASAISGGLDARQRSRCYCWWRGCSVFLASIRPGNRSTRSSWSVSCSCCSARPRPSSGSVTSNHHRVLNVLTGLGEPSADAAGSPNPGSAATPDSRSCGSPASLDAGPAGRMARPRRCAPGLPARRPRSRPGWRAPDGVGGVGVEGVHLGRGRRRQVPPHGRCSSREVRPARAALPVVTGAAPPPPSVPHGLGFPSRGSEVCPASASWVT